MKTNERFLFVRAVAFLVALGALAAGAVAQTIADVVDFDPDYGIGETERLSFDAGEVVYLEKGRGSSVVFYYPAFDHRYWQWQVDAAAAAGYRAIALSFAQPSADTQDPPLSAAAQNDLFDTAGLASALDELALGPVHFVAHSIGAWQAMTLASERPELFRTLVLEEPAVELKGAAPECSLADVSEDERAMCLFVSLVSGPGWFERQSAALRGYLAEGFGALLSGDPLQIELPSICEDVARLPMPILFIRGAETPAHFQAKLDEHEACLPEHQSLAISGAAHSVHMDRPEAYNRAVLEFIGDHEEPAAGSDSSAANGGAANGRASTRGGEIEYFAPVLADGEARLDPIAPIAAAAAARLGEYRSCVDHTEPERRRGGDRGLPRAALHVRRHGHPPQVRFGEMDCRRVANRRK